MSWETRYQNNDTPWDNGRAAPPLLDLLEKNPSFFGKDTILVPGCGTGHDARALAAASLPTLGLDLSSTALFQAAQRGPSPSLRYMEGDFLTALPEMFPPLSAIFEHTCFCAILPTQRTLYYEACLRLLPRGACWVAILFRRPRDLNNPTIGPPFQTSRSEIVSLFRPSFDLLHEEVPLRSFKGREGRELVMVWQKK